MGIPLIASESHDLISIDWTLVAELIAWLILLYILVRFLYNPLRSAMAARAERIRTELSAAEAAAQRAEEAAKQSQADVEEGKRRGEEIVRQAQQTADSIREQAINEARAEAERVIERGKAEIERERQAAVDELRRVVGDLAIQAASQVVRKSLDSDENRRLVDEAIKQSDVFSSVGSS
jgi:F-type H+-transporting ATPase subunit b